MKNNRPVFIAAIVLAVAALAFIVLQQTGSIKRELRNFAVKDTANVTKVFMADKTGKKVTLDRVAPNKWMVNNKYVVRKDAIDILLECLASVDVIYPVGKSEYNYVVKDLATGAIKVEVYVKGDLARTFYVGNADQDQTGTFMILEHSSQPFVMGIPGFIGYLTPRFFTYEQEWRDRRVFAFENPANIAKIEVNYSEKPNNSFVVEKNQNTYVVKPVGAQYQTAKINDIKVKSYVAGYMSVGLEAFTNNETRVKDSVIHATPFATLAVTAVDGKKSAIKLFYLNNINPNVTDAAGKMLAHDAEHLYGLYNDDKDLVLLQFATIDRLLKTPDSFVGAETPAASQK